MLLTLCRQIQTETTAFRSMRSTAVSTVQGVALVTDRGRVFFDRINPSEALQSNSSGMSVVQPCNLAGLVRAVANPEIRALQLAASGMQSICCSVISVRHHAYPKCARSPIAANFHHDGRCTATRRHYLVF